MKTHRQTVPLEIIKSKTLRSVNMYLLKFNKHTHAQHIDQP
ncbi:unnamed protein product [Arabidopsis halleri]